MGSERERSVAIHQLFAGRFKSIERNAKNEDLREVRSKTTNILKGPDLGDDHPLILEPQITGSWPFLLSLRSESKRVYSSVIDRNHLDVCSYYEYWVIFTLGLVYFGSLLLLGSYGFELRVYFVIPSALATAYKKRSKLAVKGRKGKG